MLGKPHYVVSGLQSKLSSIADYRQKGIYMTNEIKPVECIGDHLLVFDFNHAEDLGVIIDQENGFEILKNENAHISAEGDIWLNTSYEYYITFKEVFLKLNLYSMEHLIKLYKDYDSKYPEVINHINLNDYKTEVEIAQVISKMALRYELLKREKNIPNLQILLNILLH